MNTEFKLILKKSAYIEQRAIWSGGLNTSLENLESIFCSAIQLAV